MLLQEARTADDHRTEICLDTENGGENGDGISEEERRQAAANELGEMLDPKEGIAADTQTEQIDYLQYEDQWYSIDVTHWDHP